MTVDHKKMLEALLSWASVQMPLAAQSLRQLLNENQALDEQADYFRHKLQALEETLDSANNAIEHLRQIEDLNEKTLEAQAKEIERLKIERDYLKASIEGCKGIEEYYVIQCRLRECQADKAEQVKEIERLKQDRIEMNISALAIKAEAADTGNKLLEITNNALEAAISKIEQLRADKAEAVEALRFVSNVYERELLDYPTALEECVNVADKTLQRIESGDKV